MYYKGVKIITLTEHSITLNEKLPSLERVASYSMLTPSSPFRVHHDRHKDEMNVWLAQE